MKIGIISDTHNILPKTVRKHFTNVEYIFHAGDIGDLKIIDDLKQLAPVIAVHGNIDGDKIKKIIPSVFFDTLENHAICLIHDIGSIKNFSYELFKSGRKADIVIYGHTHKPTCETYQKTIYINPGSASFPRTQRFGTIAIANFDENSFSHQFINLEG